MAAKNWKNRKFVYLLRSIFYYPAGQKFDRNRSISYGFRDICDFMLSAKIQDGRQKLKKSKNFITAKKLLLLPCGSKIRSKSLYLLQFSRYLQFSVFRKNSRWPPKIEKIKNFDIFSHPAGPKFDRNGSISYGFRDICDFMFSAKIQDGRQKLKKWKILISAKKHPLLPCGSKIRSKLFYLLRFSRY